MRTPIANALVSVLMGAAAIGPFTELTRESGFGVHASVGQEVAVSRETFAALEPDPRRRSTH